MAGIFENFKKLKQDMEKNGWIIDAFDFVYKQISYITVVSLYLEGEKRPKYALLKVEIIQIEQQKSIQMPANIQGFMIDAKNLREFFGIKYCENLGDLLTQFNQNFAKFIPDCVKQKQDYLKEAIIKSLSKSDNENADKIYCYALKRNPNGKFRTPFNDNKTQILRPSLYSKFSKDKTISFCYCEDKNLEKSDCEIIENFANQTKSFKPHQI